MGPLETASEQNLISALKFKLDAEDFVSEILKKDSIPLAAGLLPFSHRIPFMCGQDAFPDAYRFWRDLDHFIVFYEIYCALKRHRPYRGQDNIVILS